MYLYVHVFGQSHSQRYPQILALNARKHKSRFKATNLGFTPRYTNSKLCLWRLPLRRQEHSDKRQLDGSLIREASPDVTPNRRRTGRQDKSRQITRLRQAFCVFCCKFRSDFVRKNVEKNGQKPERSQGLGGPPPLTTSLSALTPFAAGIDFGRRTLVILANEDLCKLCLFSKLIICIPQLGSHRFFKGLPN